MSSTVSDLRRLHCWAVDGSVSGATDCWARVDKKIEVAVIERAKEVAYLLTTSAKLRRKPRRNGRQVEMCALNTRSISPVHASEWVSFRHLSCP